MLLVCNVPEPCTVKWPESVLRVQLSPLLRVAENPLCPFSVGQKCHLRRVFVA